jgi:hypothetical protein
MQIGYARVSTPEQSLALQLDALRQAGAGKSMRRSSAGPASSAPSYRTCSPTCARAMC